MPISPYDANCGEHLALHNIHPFWKSQKPYLETVYDVLAAPRSSLSPSEFSTESFENFRMSARQASNERDVLEDVIPTILGTRDPNNHVAREMIFSGLKALTNGKFKSVKPDFAYGAPPGQLDPIICAEIGCFIAPGPNKPLVPNFFLEVKGPDGSSAVLERQARYDGALGARAMHQLQNYNLEKPIYDGKPYTFSSTYLAGTVKLYAHHLTAPTTPGGQPEYHMMEIDSLALTGNIHSIH